MSTVIAMRRLAVAVFVACAAAAGLRADDQVLWRSWGVHDGLAETYTYRLGVGADGMVYARHGAVREMSVFDGYGVRRIAEPRGNVQPYWPAETHVYASPGGSPWVISQGELREYRAGKWLTRYVPPAGERLVGAIPVGRRVVVFTETAVREYDPDQGAWRAIIGTTRIAPLSAAASASPGEIWLTGEYGLGHLSLTGEGGLPKWSEIDGGKQGLYRFDFPEPGAPGELFAQATSRTDRRRRIVHWAGSELQQVYSSGEDKLIGWRGPDDCVWIVDGASLFRLAGGRKQKVERAGALSGTVFDVFAESNRTFWISTSEGISRFSPTLWRQPGELDDLDQPVHAAAEDSRGRLWFSATGTLLEHDGTSWIRHPLPDGTTTHTVQTRSLLVMPDGRLLVKAVRANRTDLVLIFDPKTARFSELLHPDGRRITLLYPRPQGGVWVATEVPGVPGFRLDVFDHGTFDKQLEVGAEWKGSNVRNVVERADGDIWMGGSAGGAVYHRGTLVNLFDAGKGYTDSGVFAQTQLPSGEMIAGGRDQILKYDGKSWKLLRSGLDRIRSIALSGDGALWVASATGIHRFKDGSWIDHQAEEGLPSVIAYLVFRDGRGRLWAGTTQGLAVYEPQADTDPPRTILDASLNASEVLASGDARIAFSGNDKWNQTNPDRLLFSYRLDGGDWSPFLSSNSAVYRHLRQENIGSRFAPWTVTATSTRRRRVCNSSSSFRGTGGSHSWHSPEAGRRSFSPWPSWRCFSTGAAVNWSTSFGKPTSSPSAQAVKRANFWRT